MVGLGVRVIEVKSITNPLPAGTNKVGKVDIDVSAVDLFSTAQQAINSTASQITASAASVGVIIKALSTNSGIIYVGTSSGVTTSNGFELKASEAVTIDVNNANKIWCIGSADGQKICVMVV